MHFQITHIGRGLCIETMVHSETADQSHQSRQGGVKFEYRMDFDRAEAEGTFILSENDYIQNRESLEHGKVN